jgi:hypothetical protein
VSAKLTGKIMLKKKKSSEQRGRCAIGIIFLEGKI